MFARLIAALLPTRMALWWANRARAHGDLRRALIIADDRLRRLRADNPFVGHFQFLRGCALRGLRNSARATEAFLEGYEQTRTDPGAFSFLVRELLRAAPNARHVEVLIDYFSQPPAGEDRLQIAAN